jgi:hypothetical protein
MASTIDQIIVAQALSDQGSTLAITAGSAGDASNEGADNRVYVKNLDYTNPLQKWEFREARPDGAFALINKVRGLCIARDSNHQGANLILVPVDQIAINDLAVWRHDSVPGTYNAINSYADWEQKINIPGNGPYRNGQELITWEWSGGEPNELWVAVSDTTRTTINSIDFSIDQGVIQDENPLVAGMQTVSNNTGQDQDQKLSFSFIESHTYSFKQERGLKVSESIEFKAGLPIIGESKVAIKVEGSWTFSETHGQSKEHQVSVEVPVKVPAHTAVRVSVIILRAQLNVPFNAVVHYEYPDGSSDDKSTSGLFTGVNGYTVATKFEEIGSIPDPSRLTRVAFDRMRETVKKSVNLPCGCGTRL